MEEAGRFARIAFRQREDHVRRAKPCADARVSARCTRAAGRIEARLMSALPPKADITAAQTNVRFVPKADICSAAIKWIRRRGLRLRE